MPQTDGKLRWHLSNYTINAPLVISCTSLQLNPASWMSVVVFLVAYLVKVFLHHRLGGAQLVVNPGTVHGFYNVIVKEQRF